MFIFSCELNSYNNVDPLKSVQKRNRIPLSTPLTLLFQTPVRNRAVGRRVPHFCVVDVTSVLWCYISLFVKVQTMCKGVNNVHSMRCGKKSNSRHCTSRCLP